MIMDVMPAESNCYTGPLLRRVLFRLIGLPI